MTLEAFLDDPWRSSHKAYQQSAFTMYPAPEYANSEVILSSLYRQLGFSDTSESLVYKNGAKLDDAIQKARDEMRKPNQGILDPDVLHTLLQAVLESPKLPNQSSKRFLQITPLVPQSALFSGSARLGGNSWPAGALVRRMIWLGSPDALNAKSTWDSLFGALSVDHDDDMFARFLQAELEAWQPLPKWELSELTGDALLDSQDAMPIEFPAKTFVKDLSALISAKSVMTRRQWTSLLEATVRLAAVAHVQWICDVQARIWDCLNSAVGRAEAISAEEVRERIFPRHFAYFNYGYPAVARVKDRISAFLKGRLGINAFLWLLDPEERQTLEVTSASDIAALCSALKREDVTSKAIDTLRALDQVSERENRVLLCKKGIGNNIAEFTRHVIGQRQTANSALRGYDQGFSLRKKGSSNSSPWVVGLGPVAVLSLVHCALARTKGPRSIRRLSQHLAAYGVIVDHRDIATNDLGHQLRMLGLVLDSPDAESGMLLVSPFPAVEVG